MKKYSEKFLNKCDSHLSEYKYPIKLFLKAVSICSVEYDTINDFES